MEGPDATHDELVRCDGFAFALHPANSSKARSSRNGWIEKPMPGITRLKQNHLDLPGFRYLDGHRAPVFELPGQINAAVRPGNGVRRHHDSRTGKIAGEGDCT